MPMLFRRVRRALRGIKDNAGAVLKMARLGRTGSGMLRVIASSFTVEVLQTCDAWSPDDPQSSLRVADSCRRLVALIGREVPNSAEAPGPPELHAEWDSWRLAVDELEQAMRSLATAGPEDAEPRRRASLAIKSGESSRVRLWVRVLMRMKGL